MDVFALRDRLKSEHEQYFESFVQIAADRIRAEVEAALAAGLLWPYPRVGLNPAFKPGGTVDELANSGRLHPSAQNIFRVRKSELDPTGKPMTLHRHQTEAIEYRTKRLILECYDAMAAAFEAAHGSLDNTPNGSNPPLDRSSLAEYSRLLAEALDATYATVLDPPPADPSQVHPESTRPAWG